MLKLSLFLLLFFYINRPHIYSYKDLYNYTGAGLLKDPCVLNNFKFTIFYKKFEKLEYKEYD